MKTWQVTVSSSNGPVSYSFKAKHWDCATSARLVVWSDENGEIVFGTRIELLQAFQVISE